MRSSSGTTGCPLRPGRVPSGCRHHHALPACWLCGPTDGCAPIHMVGSARRHRTSPDRVRCPRWYTVSRHGFRFCSRRWVEVEATERFSQRLPGSRGGTPLGSGIVTVVVAVVIATHGPTFRRRSSVDVFRWEPFDRLSISSSTSSLWLILNQSR